MRRVFILAVGLLFMLSGTATGAVYVNQSIPWSTTFPVPCANGGVGETVEIQGLLHTLVTWTVNDNRTSLTEHFNLQGVTGVGMSTGDTYRVVGSWGTVTNRSVDGWPYTYTYLNDFKVIGPGPDNNFLIHGTFHLTLTPDGAQAVLIDNFWAACR